VEEMKSIVCCRERNGIGVRESKNIPGRGGELLDCLGDFDSPPAEASVVVPMMTMMYYILGRAARLMVLDWTGRVGWVAVRAAKDGGRRKSQMRSEARKKQKSSAAAVCDSYYRTGRFKK
jgi:hypothetical protein